MCPPHGIELQLCHQPGSYIWRCEICSAMFSVNSWPSVLNVSTDASLTLNVLIVLNVLNVLRVILWWAGPCGWLLATAALPYLPSKFNTKRAHRKLKLLLRTLEEPDMLKQLWGHASCPGTANIHMTAIHKPLSDTRLWCPCIPSMQNGDPKSSDSLMHLKKYCNWQWQ